MQMSESATAATQSSEASRSVGFSFFFCSFLFSFIFFFGYWAFDRFQQQQQQQQQKEKKRKTKKKRRAGRSADDPVARANRKAWSAVFCFSCLRIRSIENANGREAPNKLYRKTKQNSIDAGDRRSTVFRNETNNKKKEIPIRTCVRAKGFLKGGNVRSAKKDLRSIIT